METRIIRNTRLYSGGNIPQFLKKRQNPGKNFNRRKSWDKEIPAKLRQTIIRNYPGEIIGIILNYP
jgi:hypothetical protein